MIKKTFVAALALLAAGSVFAQTDQKAGSTEYNMWNTAQINTMLRLIASGATGLSVLALVARSTLATMTVRLRLATEFRRLSM